MSHPDPPQVPSGPWHPRHLIEMARRNGWQHIIYSMGAEREHVWRSRDWKVQVWEERAGSWELVVKKRPRDLSGQWDTTIAEVTVTSATQVYGVLVALGVLPSLEERAA